MTPSTRAVSPLLKWFERLPVSADYSPALLAVLLMLPRLLSAQFGLFDDGRILVTAERIARGIWYTGADSLEGRFRPIHWLWFTLSYLVGGKNPFWFYIANTLAFVLIVVGLIFLVRAVSGSRFQAWMAGLVFVLAGPVPESFLTLKGEVIQLTLIVLSLLAMLLYPRAKTALQKAGGIALITLALVLAYLTKETALVLLPVSLVWYLGARFWPGYEKDRGRVAARGAFLAANMLAVPIFFLMRKAAISAQISGGTYSGQYTFQLGQIAISALRWAGWLVRDFVWTVPLILLAVVFILVRRRAATGSLLLEAFVWMGAWICVYLPWIFMAEYYMLPFALGVAVFVAACAAEIAAAFGEKGWRRGVSAAVIGLSLVLLAGALLNNLTNARVQLAVDAANARMLAHLAEEAAPNSTIYVNIQVRNEYVVEMETQLTQVNGRSDLKIATFQPGLDLSRETGVVYIVSPLLQNQPLLTVRMGMVEATQKIWNQSLDDFLQSWPDRQVVFEVTDSFRLSDINFPRLFCPFVKTRAFCATPAPFVDTRTFDYGWTIYKLSTQ